MKKTLLITSFVLYVISLRAQVLYNLTSEGGSSSIMGKFGYGTIGKFLPARNQLTAVKSFVPEGNLGHTPYASLVLASDGKMYGVTIWGGDNNRGVIFSFDPHSSTYTKVKEFHGNDGERPYGALIEASDKKLYGMTYYGGSNRVGVIYSFDPSTSQYTKLHDFGLNTEGRGPYGSLVQASDGKLYGMTQEGGSSGAGTIFSFDPSSSTFKNLKDFDYVNDGGYPGGSLVQASDGKLYGVAGGGKTGNGVIFSLDPAISTFQKLKDLDTTDGSLPIGSLIQATDGKLYGTTYYRGVDSNGFNIGYGVIFSFDPSTFQYTNLHDFDFDKDGAYPLGSLLQASDGKLYGGTSRGGKNDNGSIFSFDPLNSKFTKLVDYDGLNGGAWASGGKFIEVDECFDADSTWYKDADNDGYGDLAYRQRGCPRPAGYVADSTDCDDNNQAIHAPVTFYRDFDSDGFGNARDTITTCSYTPPVGYVADSTDCNDNNKDILGPFTYYKDYDLDGFGDPYHPIHTCSDEPPATYVRNNYDCYDGDPSDTGLVRIRMCHDGWTQCVYVKDTAEKLRLGWSLGLCPLQSCGADETLMCHNGRQECVKTTEVEAKLAETGGKWSLGPYCSGVPISNRPELTRQKKIAKSVTEKLRPTQYSLSNHPNPFAGTSTIKYELPLDSKVSIKVYDLMGRTVATLVDDYKKAGTYTVNFDARRLSTGSLFYKIIAKSKEGQYQQTNQMVKIK